MNQIKRDSSGFTLIETATAILLIGLVFIAFFGIFLSSKKMGVASESIIDATYIAQHALESVYQKSKSVKIDSLVRDNSFCTEYKELSDSSGYSCTRNLVNHPYIDDPTKYSVEIEFFDFSVDNPTDPNEESNFYNVVVSIKENLKLKASMESFYKFPN